MPDAQPREQSSKVFIGTRLWNAMLGAVGAMLAAGPVGGQTDSPHAAAIPSAVPPAGQARLLLAIVSVGVVLLAALIVLTAFRRFMRIRRESQDHQPSRPVSASPWEEAGQRAEPIDPHGSTGPGGFQSSESPREPGL